MPCSAARHAAAMPGASSSRPERLGDAAAIGVGVHEEHLAATRGHLGREGRGHRGAPGSARRSPDGDDAGALRSHGRGVGGVLVVTGRRARPGSTVAARTPAGPIVVAVEVEVAVEVTGAGHGDPLPEVVAAVAACRGRPPSGGPLVEGSPGAGSSGAGSRLSIPRVSRTPPLPGSKAPVRSLTVASRGRRIGTVSWRSRRWAGSSSAGCRPMTRIALARRRATTSRSSPRRSNDTTATWPTPASATERSSATSAQRRAIVTPGTRSSSRRDGRLPPGAEPGDDVGHAPPPPTDPTAGTSVSFASPSTASTRSCTVLGRHVELD